MTATGHDIDLMDATVFRAGVPHGYFRELRTRHGLHHTRDAAGHGYWHLVRHREVVAASRDTAVFASHPSTMTSVRQQSGDRPIIAFLDGREHNRLRRLTSKGFAPARLDRLREPIRAVTDRLLAEMSAAGRFDLAEDVALQLPREVLVEFLGIPHSERADLLAWSRRIVNLGDPGYHRNDTGPGDAFEKIYGCLLSLARRREAEPCDDLFSVLLSARFQGDRLTPVEVAHFATTVMNAGMETVYSSITAGVPALLDQPGQLALLRDNRELIPGAVEEIVRWVSPVTHFARNVVQDVEVSGQQIRAGERVLLWYTSANRDETVFATPDRLDITRSPNPHVAFGGGGPHICIGGYLAALELRCFLESWLDRLGELELTGEPVHTETNFINSYKRVPVRFR